jgi:hypothetical protein
MARLLFHLMAGVIDLGVGALVWSLFAKRAELQKTGPLPYYVLIAPLVSMYLTHSFLLAYAL